MGRYKLHNFFLLSYKAFEGFVTHQEKWIFRVRILMLAYILYTRLHFGIIFYWHQSLRSTELLSEEHWLLCSLPKSVCGLTAWMPSFGWNFLMPGLSHKKWRLKTTILSLLFKKINKLVFQYRMLKNKNQQLLDVSSTFCKTLWNLWVILSKIK